MAAENALSFNDDDLDPRGDNPEHLDVDPVITVKLDKTGAPAFEAFAVDLVAGAPPVAILLDDISRCAAHVRGSVDFATGARQVMIGKADQMQNGRGAELDNSWLPVTHSAQMWAALVPGATSGRVSVYLERQV